ncbi:hypothetical protein KBTX_00482 [wastewater metagenome]|uniref:Uncharacterized protein n=2 Tax=unclassified sequences TaxID=12908 RepID=A0A5B8R5P5_9ZZZZ|nr:hypothetical protein [Arhodomonas sp. KWT]QEA04179.1 hypothetical protein KBTEX_00482 [uncultured organism]
MNRQALYGFLIGIATLAAVVIWFYAFVMPGGVPEPPAANLPSTQDTTERAAAPEPRDREPAETAEPRPEVATDEAPPLFQQERKPAPSGQDGNQHTDGSALGEGGRVRRIQRELASIAQSPGQGSPQRVGELLGQLRSTLGTSEVAGVDLRRLEETVKNAGRIQSLANEMKSIADDPGKQDRQRIRGILAEMRRLQGQLPEEARELKGGE